VNRNIDCLNFIQYIEKIRVVVDLWQNGLQILQKGRWKVQLSTLQQPVLFSAMLSGTFTLFIVNLLYVLLSNFIMGNPTYLSRV